MSPEASAPGAVERLVRRDRVIVVIGLVVLCALAWLWVIQGAGMGMSALEMTRKGLFPHLGAAPAQMRNAMPTLMPMSDAEAIIDASGWMDMAPAGRTGEFLLVTSMWWVMMIAMMLPSAAQMMLLYAGTARFGQRKGRMSAPPSTAFFLAGYLVVWLGLSSPRRCCRRRWWRWARSRE